jgi:hypothetical protein
MLTKLEKLEIKIQNTKNLRNITRVEILALTEANDSTQSYPIKSYTIGTTNNKAPVMFFVGGVHGLERIGAELCYSILKTTLDRLLWDHSLENILSTVRLVFIPLANPYGYFHFRRSNPNGVDLMRNSPVIAEEKTPYLLGGHKISSKLPWYQGDSSQMEIESQAILKKFEIECRESVAVISLDFHSGFGFKDRLWFPYSNSRKEFHHLPEISSLIELFEQSYPYHIYKIEPQCEGYLISGDLWDHIYFEHQKHNTNTYLPLTLEMGSWNWVKKNPLQLFTRDGLFNPVKDHRRDRTFRRHHLLFDFLMRGLYSHEKWAKLIPSDRALNLIRGRKKWYE